MIKEEMLLRTFKNETSGRNYAYAEGEKIFREGLVGEAYITTEDNLICIDGLVFSESLVNEYNTKIEIDAHKKNIFSTYCTCDDYKRNESKKENYCCKHLAATFYGALKDLVKNPIFNEDKNKENHMLKNKTNVLSFLLGEEEDKEEIKIEVYVSKYKWEDSITAEFKIGTKAMTSSGIYTLKDIDQFLLSLHSKIPITYSKNFTFDITNQKLSTKDKRLIDFIEMLKEIEGPDKYLGKNKYNLVEGRLIKIPRYFIRGFFETIENHKVYLGNGFFHRNVKAEILREPPQIDFDLKLVRKEYILKSSRGMPISLSDKNDVLLYGTDIYLPDYEFCSKIDAYLQTFNNTKTVSFSMKDEDNILRKLIPKLNTLSEDVTLSKSIKDKIVMENPEFSFYFDKEGNNISLILKVKYGTYEFNIFEHCKEKIIYRDSPKEAQVINTLKKLGFEEIKKKFYLLKEDDYIFDFFKHEIGKLQQIGEVFYSERFKGLKSIGTKGIIGNIKSGNYDYFEMDFKIGDIPQGEIKDILRAFRDNLKYYKLKDGEYLDLQEMELKKFLKLLEAVAAKGIDSNGALISKSKAAYVEDYLESEGIKYIKGKEELKKVTDKLKNIKNLTFEIPKDLKANLRDYQKIGFNWLKTLDYLGFGGILGDEMGLGKTLQTIAFIASNKGSKSLIVTPTSLIYNWVSEFEKFAPSVTVTAVSGTREEREHIFKNISNYDVIITTYSLLKRDLDFYKSIDFHYCILDEAQYIKNPNSQNALSVKEIKAKIRFALSGTPIENSLMELWSIFDFIMPGYLYDEKEFSVRYHKKLRETPVVIEDLNKLIKPFVLRRRKSEVIKELPDKIEKILMVNMEQKQKKVYKAYADYAMDLIKKKVKDDEFKNSKIEILSYITRLRQLCLDPSIVMDNYNGESAKLEALVELLDKSIGEGHKILIFSQFTSVLENIGKRIEREGISYNYLEGSVPSAKRMDMVREFNERETPVFLISLKAGGTGLNLTSADIVIHFDPWWNPAVEEQATDRAHRIGQENVVEVIKLVARGTIEEKIIKLQQDKKKLIEEVMDEELSNAENFSRLNEEEIFRLFDM